MVGVPGAREDAVVGKWRLGGNSSDELAGAADPAAAVGAEGAIAAQHLERVGVAGEHPRLLRLAPVDRVVDAEAAKEAVGVGPDLVDGRVKVRTGVRAGRAGGVAGVIAVGRHRVPDPVAVSVLVECRGWTHDQ